MGDDYCVVIFVKSPEKGMVKSRLAASVGDDAALDLYKCFVEDIIGMLTGGGFPLVIFFYPAGSAQQIVRWLGNSHKLFPQSGDDLGARMKNAFQTLFSQGLRSVLLIGSDSPDLTDRIIDEALMSLHDHDVVLGPSYDGGYYLIGFKAETFLSDVFEGIPWSSSEVSDRTLAILEKAGMNTYILPKWRDIDTLDDLEKFVTTNQITASVQSATMNCFRNIKRKLS